jgi:hypothetical protein
VFRCGVSDHLVESMGVSKLNIHVDSTAVDADPNLEGLVPHCDISR